jgi:voltage-gated sodium channel
MEKIKRIASQIADNKIFEFFIIGVIITNSALIGIETFYSSHVINIIQEIILGIFTIEIVIRFIAAKNIKSFLKDGWNIFDLTLVIIGYIPATIFSNASMITALRVLRIFRVLRLLRTTKELKLIVNVLIKSMRSMLYNLILFLIFVYLYAIAGVAMFRLPDVSELEGEKLETYNEFMENSPHVLANHDPFGNLGEAIFTLFRELTGDGWTELRYNHIDASERGLIDVSSTIITTYHVSWFCIAAFLMLNLITGAVINNYQIAINEQETEKKRKRIEKKEKRNNEN